LGASSSARCQVERLLYLFQILEFSAASDLRRPWEETICDARRQLDVLLTPMLDGELRQQLDPTFVRPRRNAVRELKRYSEDGAAERLPLSCPYTWEQLRDEEWFPSSRP
jgi:hypothetical protein